MQSVWIQPNGLQSKLLESEYIWKQPLKEEHQVLKNPDRHTQTLFFIPYLVCFNSTYIM